jgi:hypothetical protein
MVDTGRPLVVEGRRDLHRPKYLRSCPLPPQQWASVFGHVNTT